jgi:L-malate glycosyltransferase
MNIGIVCYPTFGGSGVVATELGNFLATRGHKVHFITYSQPVRLNIFDPNIYYHEVNVQDYPLFEYQPYELALSSKMVDTVIHENIELLHVHYAIPHAYAAYMAKQILADRGVVIPVITTLHGTDITLVGKNPSYKPAVNFSINHSDAVTCVSESLKEDTLRFFDVKQEVQVITNFIDPSLYQVTGPCAKKSLCQDGQKMVTHISNFRQVKRIPDVIETFRRIHAQVPSKLVMIGDGPEREKAEDQARKAGLLRDVIFLGKTNELVRVLCGSDLFLLPSETESFGLAALEAMAAGVPVISSNAGGLAEVNLHGITGYTTAVGDVEQMAKYGIELLLDPMLHARIAIQAKEWSHNFDIEKIVPQYEALYAAAIAKVTALPR